MRRHLALIVVHHRVLEDEEYKEYKKQKDLTTARITHITTDRQATGGVPLYLAPHTGGGRPFPISTAMKNSRRIAVAVGSLLLADAAHLVHAEGGSGVVQWGIQKRSAPEDLRNKNRFRKRASTYEEVITNEESRGGYFATCRLGTPGQDLTLQLDTGSSDIWVPDSTAAVCRTDTTSSSSSSGGGCTFGSFNPDKSSTFEVIGQNDFNISYVDGSSSVGDYFTDVFEIGGGTLKNMTMGLGIKTDIAYGLVGVGYALNEAILGSDSDSSPYPNLPVHMVNEGLINTVAYSLWLNDLDASEGSILFGGIDTDKYKGDLTRINIYPIDQQYSSFLVALTSLYAVSPSGNDTLTSTKFPIPVVLDSGTTLSYLPTDLAHQIWKEVGAVYSTEFDLALIPCKMASSKGYFSFGFAGPNGPKINVHMDELVLDFTNGQPPVFTTGAYRGMDACEFGIQNFTSAPFLLGDTFLRSAYVVYDLVNNQIGIAPTEFNSTKSNIVPFPSSGAHIPSATAAPDQSQATHRPAVSNPAYAASSGFTESAGVGDNENAAPRSILVASWGVVAQAVVVGMAMLVGTALL